MRRKREKKSRKSATALKLTNIVGIKAFIAEAVGSKVPVTILAEDNSMSDEPSLDLMSEFPSCNCDIISSHFCTSLFLSV